MSILSTLTVAIVLRNAKQVYLELFRMKPLLYGLRNGKTFTKKVQSREKLSEKLPTTISWSI